ncbi:MAG: type IV secretory system conjugative DNA transfer family protein, partial [Lentimicrobiaceae bacterium]|nr:type IV secretory system conjugative DNA transfer family protein [Lentimicrobiaceae bacterium]
ENMIISDPKGELHQKTSGLAAAKGYTTILLDFRNLERSSDSWNPLEMIYDLYHDGKGHEANTLIKKMLNTISEGQRRSSKEPYWTNMACLQLYAYLKFFIATSTKKEANFYNFCKFFISNNSKERAEELSNFVAKGSDEHEAFLASTKNADNTYNCICSSAVEILQMFIQNYKLGQVLSKSSFDLRQLLKSKTAIYIVIPDEETTLYPLISIFVKATYELLIQEAQQQKDRPELPTRVNYVLDEFGNLPPLPDFSAQISAGRSRNIRFFLFVQSLSQIEEKYGPCTTKTIIGNTENLIFLSSREESLLKYFEFLCGKRYFKDLKGGLAGESLISTSELQRLKKQRCYSQALILYSRHYPFIAELPDEELYQVGNYSPVKSKEKQLPKITPYDVHKITNEIKDGKRSIVFSEEVHGEQRFFDKKEIKDIKDSDIWDW